MAHARIMILIEVVMTLDNDTMIDNCKDELDTSGLYLKELMLSIYCI